MSADPWFLDTNILVYANDTQDTGKQAIARKLVGDSVRTGQGVISTQVLAEFWVTVTRKLAQPLAPELARKQIALLEALTTVTIDRSLFLAALGLQERYRISFWDAQVLAAAEKAGCKILWTEDFSEGGTYGGLQVKNPFGPGGAY